MHTDIQKIASSFSKHSFAETFQYLSDSFTWNIVGGKILTGKEAVMQECMNSSEYLSQVTVRFSRFNVLISNDTVIVESEAEYIDADHAKSVVASCDIYVFENEKLIRITSYNVEIK
jgi:hypothetical protein